MQTRRDEELLELLQGTSESTRQQVGSEEEQEGEQESSLHTVSVGKFGVFSHSHCKLYMYMFRLVPCKPQLIMQRKHMKTAGPPKIKRIYEDERALDLYQPTAV